MQNTGRDPTPFVLPEFMSGDESAGNDEDLEQEYMQLLNLNTGWRKQNPSTKLLATQRLSWCAEASTDLVSSSIAAG